MNKENTGQGFGLAVVGLVLLAAAFIISFYMKKCIPGTIIAIVAAILSTFAFVEARKGGGPRRFALTILIITWLGALFNIVWTASSSSRVEIIDVPIDREIIIEEENQIDKEKKLKELEEKAQQLEETDTSEN
jgi:predicted PurR-regulated permease PerM